MVCTRIITEFSTVNVNGPSELCQIKLICLPAMPASTSSLPFELVERVEFSGV